MMNGEKALLAGRDVLQTHVVVDIVHYPQECDGCFELRFIGRRKRRSGKWGKTRRMYRCYVSDIEIDKLLEGITQKYGGNITRVIVVDRDELEEHSE